MRVLFGGTDLFTEGLHPGGAVHGIGSLRRVALVLNEIMLQHAVDDEVGVAADGRGEVAVILFIEPVVPVGRVAVNGFLQAAQELGPKGVALGMLGQNLQELGDFFAVRKVAHDDFERAEEFTEFAEPFGVGIVVNAVERGEFLQARQAGHGLVGGEHELFDELVTFVVLDFFKAIGVAVLVHKDFGLGHVEIEAAVGHTVAAELTRDFPEGTNPRLQVCELGVGQLTQGAAGGAGLVFGWQR